MMEGLTDQRWPKRVVVAGAIGDTELVQSQLELKQVAPVLGIGPGDHYPDGQPVFELVLVDHRQLSPRRALLGWLQRRFQEPRHMVPKNPLACLELP